MPKNSSKSLIIINEVLAQDSSQKSFLETTSQEEISRLIKNNEFEVLGQILHSALKSQDLEILNDLLNIKEFCEVIGQQFSEEEIEDQTISNCLYTALNNPNPEIKRTLFNNPQFKKRVLSILEHNPRGITNTLAQSPEILKEILHEDKIMEKLFKTLNLEKTTEPKKIFDELFKNTKDPEIFKIFAQAAITLLTQEVDRSTGIIPDVSDIVAQYLVEDRKKVGRPSHSPKSKENNKLIIDDGLIKK